MNDLKITYQDTLIETQATIVNYFKHVKYIKSFIDDPEAITAVILIDKSDLSEKFEVINRALNDIADRSRTVEIGMKYIKAEIKNIAYKISELHDKLHSALERDFAIMEDNHKLLNRTPFETLNTNMKKLLDSVATREYGAKKIELVLAPYLAEDTSVNAYLNGVLNKLELVEIDLAPINNGLKNNNDLLETYIKQIELGDSEVTVVDNTELTKILPIEHTLLTELSQIDGGEVTSETNLEILKSIVDKVTSNLTTYNDIALLSDSINLAETVNNSGHGLINDKIPKLVSDYIDAKIGEKEYSYLLSQYENVVYSATNVCATYVNGYTRAEIEVLKNTNNTLLINKLTVETLVAITVG